MWTTSYIQFPVHTIDLHNLGLIKASAVCMGCTSLLFSPKFVEKFARIPFWRQRATPVKSGNAERIHGCLRSHFELYTERSSLLDFFSRFLYKTIWCGGGGSDSLVLQKWVIGLQYINMYLYIDSLQMIIDHMNCFLVFHLIKMIIWSTHRIPQHSPMMRDPKMSKSHLFLLLPPPNPSSSSSSPPRWRTPDSSPPPPRRAPHYQSRPQAEVQSRSASRQPAMSFDKNMNSCNSQIFPPVDLLFWSR